MIDSAKGVGDLPGAVVTLRAAKGPKDIAAATRSVLQAAGAHVRSSIDIDALTAAGTTILERLPDVPSDAADRSAFLDNVHRFIDLARDKRVRAAAYPPEPGRPGGVWIDLVCKLIEKSDFHVGAMLRQRAGQYPDRNVFVVPRRDQVAEYALAEVLAESERIARGALALLGDDARVALYTPNRIEGVLCDLAFLGNGIFVCSVPANATQEQVEHILAESGARLVVVSGAQQVPQAFAALQRVPSIEWLVSLDVLPHVPGGNVLTLAELIERGAETPADLLTERSKRVRALDVATTMYTSGTTGAPKGIQFTQLSLVSKRYCRAAALPEIDEHEVLLCYLPLYHTFGRFLEMLGCVHLAAAYVFAEDASTETIIRNMQTFRPTAMISVPKKWIDLRRAVVAHDEPPDNPDEVRKALAQLTGGRLRWGLSAAGRLDPAVFRFFQNAGVDLLSGYGMTEATGGITMTPPGQYRDDSIGKALPGIELGLGEDGELMLRGPYVTQGYTNPEDNKGVFRDGWFCTGDVVQKDEVGFIRHVDRKKDIYKNAQGRTVAPQRVESLFADFPEVSRVFAVGDGREYVSLLIRPNMSYPEVRFAEMPPTEVEEYFRGLVATCNRFLAPFERVVKFAVIDRDFSAERGELTDKGSFRRSAVAENFRDVIERMYESSTIERKIDGLRIRVPFAFLQHLGGTESGLQTVPDGLAFRAIDRKLTVRRDSVVVGRVWVGNCCYEIDGDQFDLDDWLRLPRLWVGNAELSHIAGESILLWSLSRGDRSTPARLVGMRTPISPVEEWRRRLDTTGTATPSLMTIHSAAVFLSAPDPNDALVAVEHLTRAITAGRASYQELAETHLQLAAMHPQEVVRSRAFAALFEHQPVENFGRTAAMFCESLRPFLDEEAVATIAALPVDGGKWSCLAAALASLRRIVAHSRNGQAESFAQGLLEALGRIPERNPDYFLPVRRELTAWMLAKLAPPLPKNAERIANRLVEGVRHRLPPREPEVVDPDTGETFTWADACRFEDGIDPGELARITAAMLATDLIPEAVHLLHQRHKLGLEDLTPGSVWISLLGTRFGRSVYHVGVRLRNRERVDFTLYVNSTAATEAFVTDLRLMTVAAGGPGETALTPKVGGYWPQYGLATLEYIPGEPLESLTRHMHDHPDRDVLQRLRGSWRHLSWAALTAAYEFHRRTERQWMLVGTVTRDVSVPLNDFDENIRVVSAAGWRPFEGTLDMVLRLKRALLDRVRFHFPALIPHTQDEILFAAAIEALGMRDGLSFLEEALSEAGRTVEPDREVVELAEELRKYIGAVRRDGYMPRALYCAIERYRAWEQQVPEANTHARAAQLHEIKNNYRIEEVRRKFPGSRLWLFAETVLRNAPPEGQRTIREAIVRLRDGASIKDVLGRLYVELKETMPSQDQQYFLTRATYPHLEVDTRAELVRSGEVGQDRAELATHHTDRIGRFLKIRPAANSREVDTLNRIFYASGIGGGLTSRERLLVGTDQAGYVVGGVAFIRRTPSHVILDKIAVLPRNRGRGIGQILLEEFLRRQAADGVKVVSAEFIRASWLEPFGFRSHPRYPGIVLELHGDRIGRRESTAGTSLAPSGAA
ncbi:MAG: AMP-binding protein [Phycisphaerae bacterium]|nr:AMP-binding protein [Phycisphaerae bacterium]